MAERFVPTQVVEANPLITQALLQLRNLIRATHGELPLTLSEAAAQDAARSVDPAEQGGAGSAHCPCPQEQRPDLGDVGGDERWLTKARFGWLAPKPRGDMMEG